MAGDRQNTELESYSCDEDEDLLTGFDEETFSDIDITRLSTLPELLVSDEMNQTETLDEERESLACTETGSQIARSIISNIFRKIDVRNYIGESLNPSDEKTEVIEMLSNQVMSRVGEKDKMSSIQTTSTDPDSVVQSPKTVERISNWINDLQSNVSLDGYISYSSPVTIKSRSSASKKSFNIMSIGSKDEDVYSDREEEDDQPSGYTTLLTPSSRFDVSCFESPKIRLEAHRLNSSINSFSSWLSRKDEEEEKMDLRHRKQTQALANLQYNNPEKQGDEFMLLSCWVFSQNLAFLTGMIFF
ncbi:uncharacterized protein LOC111708889 [Eurytemora carolleeae]|uniref:uncharacterized protein LOC111708889 n=1 Tax=Eurytemora carolleeae TaxID=1294199 RepID=UPI000C791315|nr:uncharacterized protein LOC111708889 [Eurytemora carolleeae]|eukprot:XP_023338165.1 uncharacterized protein LOC111708889 [Eurytemora affinis]